MQKVKKAKLLINDYDHMSDITDTIINAPYVSIDTNLPKCRLRGTFIDASDKKNNKIKIIGWQRNLGRIRKMDVSLPTIITMVINRNQIIESIELNDSFKGSKGLMCSAAYLGRNLEEKLLGKEFGSMFTKTVSVNTLHCFHLIEVLYGMYSYFDSITKEITDKNKMENFYYEEEAIDSYIINNDIMSCGVHRVINKPPVYFHLLFYDIINKISFNKMGNLHAMDQLAVDFYIGEKLCFRENLNADSFITMQGSLQRFLIKCKYNIQPYLFPELKPQKMYNTNLYPMAYIGLMTQALAIYFFQNNYEYIMHAITSLQRSNNIPLCVGAVKNKKEAGIYFPNLRTEDLF